MLRVDVGVRNEPIGDISFGSSESFEYHDQEVLPATKIAEHLALAVARATGGKTAGARQVQEWARLLESELFAFLR